MDTKKFDIKISGMNLITGFTRAALITIMTIIFADFAAAVPQQRTFAAGEDAVSALMKAMREENNTELLAIFGSDANDLICSGDPVADRLRRELFVQAYDQQHRLNKEADKLVLIVGKNEWPFPIPLIQQDQQWVFDTAAGKEEILNRRIGSNELHTIQVMLAIVDAQREYAMIDHDGDGLLEYAQQFSSDPNTHNGLYWETKEGQPPSPLGVLVAKAKREGYEKSSADQPQPYLGYLYRILTGQGESAVGGGFDYLVKGSMIGGFAVIAYPAQYGSSGVMTFIVNHDGVVYQKDLGMETEEKAMKMSLFDPDKTWSKIE